MRRKGSIKKEDNIRQKIDEDIISYEKTLERIALLHKSNFGIATTCSSVTDWVEWSMKNHTEDEIREKCLNDFNNVCFSYLCGASKVSEDFLIELAALSTGFMNKDNYDKYIDKIEKVIMYKYGLIDMPYEELSWYLDFYNKFMKDTKTKFKDNSSNSDVNIESQSPKDLTNLSESQETRLKEKIFDRLDWMGLTSNNYYSEEFLDKFNKHIVWRCLPLNRKYTAKFKRKYAELLPKKVEKVEKEKK